MINHHSNSFITKETYESWSWHKSYLVPTINTGIPNGLTKSLDRKIHQFYEHFVAVELTHLSGWFVRFACMNCDNWGMVVGVCFAQKSTLSLMAPNQEFSVSNILAG